MNTQATTSQKPSSLTFSKVFSTWLPLVASWALMSIELPSINAVVARLANAEVNMAAYGGVVYSLSLIIEAPVIMLLAASTALSRDWVSYQKLRKITLWFGGALMAIHLLIALTPIYDFVVNVLLHVPPEVVEPGRAGLVFMAPWSFAIAYRRFQQGAMIRHGHSKMVGQTTLVRLLTVALILTIGFIVKTIPGTILAGLAQGMGVTAEAIYAGVRIRKIYPEIKAAPTVERPLTLKRFAKFYVPLALTSSIWLLWQPLISAAISRMPNPLESLAIWSVITGLLFLFRSPGVAYNEAVVALMGEKDAYRVLRKFALLAALVTLGLALIFVLTPLSQLWLSVVANLPLEMAKAGRMVLTLGLPLTFLSVYISFYQGFIVSFEKTGAVAEAVVSFLVFMGMVLITGVVTQTYQGVYVASAAFSVAHLTQFIWLMVRSRKQRKAVAATT